MVYVYIHVSICYIETKVGDLMAKLRLTIP